LNVKVPDPCAAPKAEPVIVTSVPTIPEPGVTAVSTGAPITVNGTPLLVPAAVVTTTFPVAAPAGTVATIDASLQLPMAVAVVPLNFTVAVPCAAPKAEPVIVTCDPTIPEPGVNEVSDGAPITVNCNPLLGPPVVVVTTTFPVAAPLGTTATIDVAVQLTMVVATAPLKVTVLLPELAPKLAPEIVTGVPTGPFTGDSPVIDGGGFTVNATPLLDVPAAVVTTTLPDAAPAGTDATIAVSLQLETAAAIPPNLREPVPCVDPKLEPIIVTGAPTGAEFGVSVDMDGAGGHAVGLHGGGTSSLDDPLAARMPASAAPPPAPRMMGNVLPPGFGLDAGGCWSGSDVGRFAGRCAGGACGIDGACARSWPRAPGDGGGMFNAI